MAAKAASAGARGGRATARPRAAKAGSATVPWSIIGVSVFAYFVIYPGDIEALITPFAVALGLFHQVPPWLYVTVIALILSCTATKIWGKSR